MFERLKRKYEIFLTVFCFFLKNSLYSNSSIAIHGFSGEEEIILFLIIILVPLIVVYLLGLFLATIFALFRKKKSQEKIYVRAFYIFVICLLANNVISPFVGYDGYDLICIVTTPFLIISLIILFLVKKHSRRDNTFEDFLEKSKKNNEKEKSDST